MYIITLYSLAFYSIGGTCWNCNTKTLLDVLSINLVKIDNGGLPIHLPLLEILNKYFVWVGINYTNKSSFINAH